MQKKIRVVILTVFIGALVIFNFSAFYSARTVNTLVCCDEFEYFVIAHNLVSGHGYSIQEGMPFSPTLMREPGYPLVLAGILKLHPSDSFLWVQVFQVFLVTLTGFFLWRVAKYFFSGWFALVPSIFFLLSPRVAYYSWTILSDTFVVFLVVSSFLSLLWAYRKNKFLAYGASGVVFGALAVSKIVFILFPFVLLPLPFMFKKLKMPRWSIAAFFVGFFLLPSPWIIRNAITFHEPVLTVRSGQLLDERTRYYNSIHSPRDFFQVVLGDILPSFKIEIPKDPLEKPIIGPGGAVYGLASKNAPSKFFSLVSQGFSERDADKQMVQASLDRMKNRPDIYIAQMIPETIKFIYPEFFPGLFYRGSTTFLSIISIGLLSLLFVIFLVQGICVSWHKRREETLLLLSIIFYVGILHILLYVTPRYNFPIYPLLLILVARGMMTAWTIFRVFVKQVKA